MMETNNYTTDLQLVSQEYSDEKISLQTKTKKLLEHISLTWPIFPLPFQQPLSWLVQLNWAVAY